MKSATAFIQSLRGGLAVDTALTSLAPYDLEYYARIPINIYRASQQLGWRFFPVPRCGRYAGGNLLVHRATSDLQQLKVWARPRPNWALATGFASGVFVAMIEGQEGRDLLLSLCGDDWNWLDTVRTWACQKHFIFFTWPKGRQQRDGISCLGKGLRILGNGDWLLMPPSREKDGTRHVYLNPQLSLILPPPAWLIDLVFTPARRFDHLESVVPSNYHPALFAQPTGI